MTTTAAARVDGEQVIALRRVGYHRGAQGPGTGEDCDSLFERCPQEDFIRGVAG